ncbi:MAG: hypothetical protein ACI9GZ_002646 [Bacteroidia bacterium]|jgi:uncharacterized protein (DUF1501 family)
MKRRSFIKYVSHSVALPSVVSSFGFALPGQQSLQNLMRLATENGRVLVLIYLSGGNDGLNTVVPLDQLSVLNSVRPDVVLPDDSLHELVGTSVGLHPKLSGLKSLYDEGKLKVIQSVGYEDQSFSHFRSTDIWMSGSQSHVFEPTGWSGRYLANEYPDFPTGYPNENFTDPISIEVGGGGSLLFQGPNSGMSMVIKDPENFYQLLNNEVQPAPETNAGNKLEHIRLIAQQSQAYGEVVKAAADKVNNQKEYPDENLAEQLKIVAKLIKGGLKTPVYMVKLGGFDTHSDQVDSDNHTIGNHADLLQRLNDAIMAFTSDLEHLGIDDRVLGMTFSEFGRRIISNASNGTDHGAAAPLFIFGNHALGGVLGSNPVIPSDADKKDNLPMEFDFKQVYASVLEQWMGTSEFDTDTITLGNHERIQVIRDPNAVTGLELNEPKVFGIYPNPIKNDAEISFISDGSQVSIDLFDMQGRNVGQVYSGKLPMGKQKIDWRTNDLTKGRYIVVFKNQNFSYSKKVIKQ